MDGKKERTGPGPWKSAAVAAICALVPCIIVPLQTWLGNSTALGFGAGALLREFFVLWILVAAAIWLFVWLGGRLLGRLPLAFVLVGAFYAYLETGILTIGYPPLDGELVFWSNPVRAAIDTAILVAIVAAAVALRRVLDRYAVAAAGCIALLGAASLLDVRGELIQTADTLDNEFASGFVRRDLVAESAFFSTNRNIVVLILDATTDEILDEVLKADPVVAETFDGFRVFQDHVGMYPTTPFAVAGLATGLRYDSRLTFGEYVESAFSTNSFLSPYQESDVPMFVQLGSFKRFGYTNRAVVDREEGMGPACPVIFHRIEGEQEWSIAQLTAFRMTPFALKSYALRFFMWRWGAVRRKSLQATDNENRLYPQLGRVPIRLDEPLTLHIYHTHGSHDPFTVDRDGNSIPPMSGHAGAVEKARRCFRLMASLLDSMKQRGVYDNSLIIVTSDHGNSAPGRLRFHGVDMRKNKFFNRAFPCLAIKVPRSHGAVRYVQEPTAHNRIRDLLVRARILDPTEEMVDSILSAPGDRVFTDSRTIRENGAWMNWVFHADGTVSSEIFDPGRDASRLPPIRLGQTHSFKCLDKSFGKVLPPVICKGLADGRVFGASFRTGAASMEFRVLDPSVRYDVVLGMEILNPDGADESVSFAGGIEYSLSGRVSSAGKPAMGSVKLEGVESGPDGVVCLPIAKSGKKAEVFFVSIRVDTHDEP